MAMIIFSPRRNPSLEFNHSFLKWPSLWELALILKRALFISTGQKSSALGGLVSPLIFFLGTHHLSFRMSPSDFRFAHIRLGPGKPGKLPWGLFSNIWVLGIWSIGKVEKLPGLGGTKRFFILDLKLVLLQPLVAETLLEEKTKPRFYSDTLGNLRIYSSQG